MKCSLISPTFLKSFLVFPVILFSSVSLYYPFKKAFLSLLGVPGNSAFSWVYLFPSPLLFTSFLSSAIPEPQSAPGLVFADCIVSSCLTAKNIINLISVLIIWWCPCVDFSLKLLEGVCYDQHILLTKLYSLCPASFCAPRPNLPATPGSSNLPTFAFQSPMMKRTPF